ncbi:hypothetical protein P6709_20160, partial [Jeotgalibacillus sp. ET6]|nr:hypothetical protein [Jeotgalibacillus sp. ET6]
MLNQILPMPIIRMKKDHLFPILERTVAATFACHEHGICVYVDVVMNHKGLSLANLGSALNPEKIVI